jgi:hypothetical protein
MATEDEAPESREIVQSRLGMKLAYEFGPEMLIYSRTDLSGTVRCSAAYEHIGIGNASYLALNNRLFTVVSLTAAILAFVVTAVVILLPTAAVACGPSYVGGSVQLPHGSLAQPIRAPLCPTACLC